MSMSNEELVAAIRAGAVERIPELWEQLEKLVMWKAIRVMHSMEINGNTCRGGVEFEDLVHSGYPALVAAVETYDQSQESKFSTWFMFYLKTAFAETAGYRTKAGRKEPLNNALSMDKPLSDEADSDLFGDYIPDPQATAGMQSVEEKYWHEQLCEAVDTAMAGLSDDQREIIQLRYYQDMTLKEIAEQQGISFERVRQKECKALRELRKPKHACNLISFFDFNYYCSTSLDAFNRTGMSIQEKYLIVQEYRKNQKELSRRQKQEARKQKKRATDDFKLYLEQLQAETDEIVSRMSAEEKQALLERYDA